MPEYPAYPSQPQYPEGRRRLQQQADAPSPPTVPPPPQPPVLPPPMASLTGVWGGVNQLLGVGNTGPPGPYAPREVLGRQSPYTQRDFDASSPSDATAGASLYRAPQQDCAWLGTAGHLQYSFDFDPAMTSQLQGVSQPQMQTFDTCYAVQTYVYLSLDIIDPGAGSTSGLPGDEEDAAQQLAALLDGVFLDVSTTYERYEGCTRPSFGRFSAIIDLVRGRSNEGRCGHDSYCGRHEDMGLPSAVRHQTYGTWHMTDDYDLK